jgi:glycosyltransferase involved in cell wall biosynthesis
MASHSTASAPPSDAITVVMPTYNGRSYIRAALESAVRQTVVPHEIIVVDDQSTDGTAGVVEEFARSSPVPVVLKRMRQNTGSPAEPINAGVAAATTEYVALLEHDDLMFPDRLRWQRAALDAFPDSAMAIGRLAIFEEQPDGQLEWRPPVAPHPELAAYYAEHRGGMFEVPARLAFRALVTANFIRTNSNILLRKSAWHRLGGYRARWPRNCDAEFEFRLFAASPMAIADQVCCGYRRSPGSLYHSNRSLSRIQGLQLRLRALELRPEWTDDLRPAIRRKLRDHLRRSVEQGHWSTAVRLAWDLLRYARPRPSRRAAGPSGPT